MSEEANSDEFIYGIHPVLEAVQAGKELQKVLINPEAKSPQINELLGVLRKQNIRHQFVPTQKLNKLVKGNHQGVIAYVSLVESVDLYDFLNLELAKGTTLRILALDHITDVRNIGALARSALAFGFHAILVPEKGSVLIHSGAIKSSAGALLKIPLIQVASLTAALKDIRLHGISIVGITESGNKELKYIPKDDHLTLVLGSEETGIRKEHLALCRDTYRIPQGENIGSLNVSVAGAVAMYELVR